MEFLKICEKTEKVFYLDFMYVMFQTRKFLYIFIRKKCVFVQIRRESHIVPSKKHDITL